MKIRDTNAYIRNITRTEKPITVLGDAAADEWLTHCYGGDTDIKESVKQISKFAQDYINQVVYEFIQNANDAKATHFYYFYDEAGILVINNGEPFYTNSSKNEKTGELKRFLFKNKSDKPAQKESIGRYGQGSKLLYDFFAKNSPNEKNHEKGLEQTLIKQHEGPILFSWSKLTHIENILDVSFQNFIPAPDFDNIDYPLLTRIIYTYYPAMPNEQQKTIISPDILISLFDANHFNTFQSTLKKFLQEYNIHPYLDKGTILFIPNSKATYEKMHQEYNSHFLYQTEISLYFLNNLKYIQINEHHLTQKKDKFQTIPIDDTTKLLFPIYPNTLPENIPILYKYFPIYNERYNLPCIIHCSEFSTTTDRQNLDTEKQGDVSLDSIRENVKDKLNQIANDSKEIYLNFLRLFLHTQNTDHEEGKSFYNILHQIAEAHIPAENGELYPKESICIKPKKHASQIKPTDIGLKELHFLAEIDSELYKKCIQKFKIVQYSVAELVQKADINEVQKYLKKLSSNQYLSFLHDIDDNIQELENYPIFYASDHSFYTLKQIIDDNSKVFILTPILAELEDILTKSGAILCNVVLQNNDICTKIIKTIEKDKNKLFDKIIKTLDTTKITHDDKWTLFKVIQKHFNKEEKEKFADTPLFTNTLGQSTSLNKLIQNYHYKIPELTATFRLHATEPYYKDFEPYLIQQKNLLEHIHQNWSTIKHLILEKNKNTLTQLSHELYQELAELSKSSSQPKSLKIDCLIDLNGNFVSAKNVFFHHKLNEFSENQYYQIVSILQKCNNKYNFLPYKDISIITEHKSIFDIHNTTLKNITDTITCEYFEVSHEFIKLFYSLYSDNFLNYFYLTQQNNTYVLYIKPKNITQYYAKNSYLIDFLNSTQQYILLPETLASIFQRDTILKLENENFATELIDRYGEEPRLIEFILQQSNNVKIRYFQKVKRFDLYSTQKYTKDSYEVKLFELSQSINKLTELKSSTYIDGKPIKDYEYINTVMLGSHSFELHQLIPEYEEKTRSLDSIYKQWRLLVKQGTGDFFQANSKFNPEQVIQHWQSNTQKCSTVYQFVFLLLYAQKKQNNQIPPYCMNIPTPTNEAQKIQYWIQIADIAKKYEFYTFEEVLKNLPEFCLPCTSYFWLEQKENEKYILPQEILPEPIQKWANQDKKNTEFIQNTSTQKDNSPVIRLRKALLQNKTEKELENDFKDAYSINTLFIENTFSYLEKQYIEDYSIVQYFIKLYIQHYQKLPSHLVYYHDWKNNRFEYAYMPINKNNELYVYSQQCDEQKVFNLVAIQFKQKNKNRNIIAVKDTKIESFFEKQGISKLSIRTEFITPESSLVKEWESFAYQECKKEGSLERKIYLVNKPLQYKFYACEEYIQQGEFDNVYYDENKQTLYVYPSGYNGKTILQILNDYKNTKIITENELLSLFSKGDIPEEERKKLEITKNYSVEQLQEFINSFSGADGSGNIHIEENKKEIIEKIAEKFTKDELEKLFALQGLDLDNITKSKKKKTQEKEEEAIVNKVTGTIGEIIALKWYKNKYPDYEVTHEDVSAYDIKITHQNILEYIEVKTTSKPLFSKEGEIEKFYLRNAQIEFILSKKYNKYTLFRLSIDGLYELNFRYEYNQIQELVEFEEIKNSLIEQTEKICTPEFLKKIEDNFILLEIVLPEKVKQHDIDKI